MTVILYSVERSYYDTIPYESRYKTNKKEKWLATVKNARSRKWYTLKGLIDNDVINENERQLFELPEGVEDYPFRTISQFKRIKTADGSEWFSTEEQWVGITDNATVVSCPVSDLHWYLVPTVNRIYRNPDGSPLEPGQNITNTRTVRIATTIVGIDREMIGKRMYMTPFTPEIVHSALRFASGKIGDPRGASLTFIKEGTNARVGCKSIEEFISAPFDAYFEQHSNTQRPLRIDSKQLLKDLTDASAALKTKTENVDQYR
jgi:hypothetical protein